jgi:hypothetical protein
MHPSTLTENDISQQVTYLFASNLALYSINTGDSFPRGKEAAA